MPRPLWEFRLRPAWWLCKQSHSHTSIPPCNTVVNFNISHLLCTRWTTTPTWRISYLLCRCWHYYFSYRGVVKKSLELHKPLPNIHHTILVCAAQPQNMVHWTNCLLLSPCPPPHYHHPLPHQTSQDNILVALPALWLLISSISTAFWEDSRSQRSAVVFPLHFLSTCSESHQAYLAYKLQDTAGVYQEQTKVFIEEFIT